MKVPLWLIGAGVAAGVALRIWVVLTPVGALDSDEAVIGLMARHVLEGEWSAIYWGQTYGGSHEAILAAGLFALIGSSTLALKAISVGLSAIAAVLVYRIGRLTVGENAGRVGALLFWVWPASFVWWSTKAHGGQHRPSLVLTMTAVLLILRFEEKLDVRTLRLPLAIGIFLGMAFWGGPQVAYFALPIGVWLLARMRTRVFRLWPAVPGVALGALPWIVYSVTHNWVSLRVPLGLIESNYLFRFVSFFRGALPAALGTRVPFSCRCDLYTSGTLSEWVPPVPAGLAQLIYIGALAGFLAALALRPRGTGLLLLIAAAYPFIFAVSPFSWYVDSPVYLLFLAPVIALLLGRAIVAAPPRFFLRAGAVAVAVAFSAAGISAMLRAGHPARFAPDAKVPAKMEDLQDVLRSAGVNRVFANYWVAYRLTFESEEELVASPIGPTRYPPHDRLVRASRLPAYVVVEGSAQERSLPRAFERVGIGNRRLESRGFVVFVPARKVLPEEISEAF